MTRVCKHMGTFPLTLNIASRTVTILSWNINGLRNTLTDFEFIAYLERFDIFSVVETWENVESDDILNLFPNHFFHFLCSQKSVKVRTGNGWYYCFHKKAMQAIYQ